MHNCDDSYLYIIIEFRHIKCIIFVTIVHKQIDVQKKYTATKAYH